MATKKPIAKPAAKVAAKKPAAKAPVKPAAKAPAKPAAKAPAKPAAKAPAKPAAKAPAKPAAKAPAKPAAKAPVKPAAKAPVKPAAKAPAKPAAKAPVKPAAKAPVKPAAKAPAKPAAKPAAKAPAKPAAKAPAKPAAKAPVKPAAKPAAKAPAKPATKAPVKPAAKAPAKPAAKAPVVKEVKVKAPKPEKIKKVKEPKPEKIKKVKPPKPEKVKKAPARQSYGRTPEPSRIIIEARVTPVIPKKSLGDRYPASKERIIAHRGMTELKRNGKEEAPAIIEISPSYNRSLLDSVDEAAPRFRYSDDKLGEFKVVIHAKLEIARKELGFLQGLITRKDDAGTEDTENKFASMEDGSASQDREMLNQLAARQITLIEKLEQALGRIENKTYGVCRTTGKLIEENRLKAVPHATLSMEAKNAR
jgi:RNA polymerase-binding transcription factor DksA